VRTKTRALRVHENWSLACIILGVISIPRTALEEVGLIRKILSGRQDLFADLIAPHLRPLLRIVRTTIGSHPDVEDIVQQTALKAFTHLEQFRFEASFRTWLIRIGLNEVRAWRRKCASSRFLALDPTTLTQLPVGDESLSPYFEYERREASVRLRTALACLPEKYRIVILLRDFLGFSLSEVAGRLGLTIPAVKTRQRRARQKMAKFLRSLSQSQPRSRACR
jgi:RNA polymerase sigma-70 factor (ECF subfamily)